MKNLLVTTLLSLIAIVGYGQRLKPYTLASKSTESMEQVKAKTKESLKTAGFDILGEYRPAADIDRYLIVISSPDLIAAVKQIGNLTGFASALRVGITKEGETVIVSYTTPAYWANAYFQDNYTKVAMHINKVTAALGKAIGKQSTFGSEEGETIDDLREYQYMMGMPEFDDTEELADFDSYQAAVAHIDKKLKEGVSNVAKVYEIEVPGKQLKLYGIALKGTTGEEQFLPIIDGSTPKHTCFLPYEILVMGEEVHMLHGRFRIALSFPDLTMMTFSKIMATPGDIEELLEAIVAK